VAALVSRGVTADPGDGADGADALGAAGVDPLVTATPLLVGVSVALVTHRALGRPLRYAVRRAARRPGLVGFLGLARAGRAGVLGASATAALTVALAVASLAAVTRATLAEGAAAASWTAVGADLRVTGAGLGDDEAAALARVPGVEAVTPVTATREAAFSVVRPGVAGRLTPDARVTVLAVDPAGLADVQRDVPGRPALPPAFAGRTATGSDGAEVLPVVVSAGLAEVGDDVRFEVGVRRLRGTVVAAPEEFPGAPADAPWMLVGVTPLREATGAELSAQVLLARAPGLADAATLPGGTLAAVRAAAGDGAVTTPANWRAESTSSALVRAVRGGVPVAVAAGGVLAALAVLLTLLAGGASRRRFLAHLRALGLSGRQAGWLVALEVVPGAAAALVAGLGAGVAMAWLVLPAADLRPLTGAVRDVGLVVDPWTVAAVALGFAAVLAAGVVAAALDQRRVSPAAAARLGDAE
jgi:putative ABC transport system permease protein